MMDLIDVVREFATVSFNNPLAEDPTETVVMGKVSPFNEVTNSGSAAQRRIIETPPDQIVPEERILQLPSGQIFIVGHGSEDYWDTKVIRIKYPALPTDTKGSYGTIGSILAEEELKELFVVPHFVRRDTDEKVRSDYLASYQLQFSSFNTMNKGEVLVWKGKYFRVRMDSSIDTAGFGISESLLLEDPVSTITVTPEGAFDPVTETMSGGEPKEIKVFTEEIGEDYIHEHPAFTKPKAGDKAISVLKSDMVPTIGTDLGEYKVLSIEDRGDFTTCHCRSGY